MCIFNIRKQAVNSIEKHKLFFLLISYYYFFLNVAGSIVF